MKNYFKPFQNESDVIQIGELNIENRVDRISIFGNIDITLDKEGLAIAKELKSIIDSTIAALQKVDLPDKIAIDPIEMVHNPFA
jgi:hypothetical protein